MKRSLLLLSLLLACSLAAEWQVLAPNVMTVAIGCSAANDKTVFVSGGDNGGGASILKSEDGGSTWVSLPHDPQAMYLSIEASLTSPYVVAGSIGFWKQTAVASISTDGQTFEGASYVPLFSASQSVGTSGTSVFIVGFWMDSALADPMDGVIASTDGGKTLTFHPWTGKTQARYGSFTSNGTWYISGGTWPSDETRKTFHSRQSNLFRRVSLKREHGSMSFNIKEHIESTNKNDYIAVIQKSTDGGQTFTTVFSDTGRFYFNGIHCLDEDNCWVVAEGDDGAWILKSSNGGQTWEEQSFQPAMSLIDVHMLNYSEGWAVGGEILSNTFNALFLHTTDGGKTWVREGVIANAYPNSITVPSGQRAYATAFLRNGLSSILGYF